MAASHLSSSEHLDGFFGRCLQDVLPAAVFHNGVSRLFCGGSNHQLGH